MKSQRLEDRLVCPQCRSAALSLSALRCGECGWAGKITAGIRDFVDEAQLKGEHHAEVAAQTNAVDEYYENELKLTCHWDRLSSESVYELLGRPRGVALDLGCGTGTAGSGLVRSGLQVVGADLSLPCLRVAARRLDLVARVDAARLPFADDSFDALVARGALHHFQEPEIALAEIRRVLKPGASALFMDPRHYAWLEPIKHVLRREDDSFTHEHHAFDPGEYRAIIERSLTVEKSETLHPFGVLVAHGLDLLPLPRALPRRPLARGLLGLDRILERGPLARFGHLLVVVAKKDGLHS
jgi:ubiquinone/menaquinone biosynthesis C-methylase UbiE